MTHDQEQPVPGSPLMERWPLIRDISLFIGGMLGVTHETLVGPPAERPTLLILFAIMMGLPAFLGGKG